jgi:hypothetical protein
MIEGTGSGFRSSRPKNDPVDPDLDSDLDPDLDPQHCSKAVTVISKYSICNVPVLLFT